MLTVRKAVVAEYNTSIASGIARLVSFVQSSIFSSLDFTVDLSNLGDILVDMVQSKPEFRIP